jgi:hypothetical protein
MNINQTIARGRLELAIVLAPAGRQGRHPPARHELGAVEQRGRQLQFPDLRCAEREWKGVPGQPERDRLRAGASVNVGGLVASTLPISKENFEKGNYVFDGGATQPKGAVENHGTIYAPNGYAALIGPKVTNTGMIVARTVALAAGNRVALDMIGDGLISVTVEQRR